MSPHQLIALLRHRAPAPAYLFVGPETYERELCRAALITKVLPEGDLENGFVRHDLDDVDLADVVDDARSLSLFAPNRLIWVGSAELALPRGRAAAAAGEDDGEAERGGAAALADYLRDPMPGVVLVFDCLRYELEGEDKQRIQRVQKFYSMVEARVEFARYTPAEARKLAGLLAKNAALKIGAAELDLLVEVLDADAARIAGEIEKLSLYAGHARNVTAADIRTLVPNARATTIFNLVAALGRGNRAASLDALDLLVKEGEYLPLALNFLATQFRLALAASEAGLRNPSQIQAHFSKLDTPMWRSRAEQIAETVSVFSADKMRAALARIFETDKALRDARPDDRVVMENFVLALT
ncbi:MAG: DNA polymerase III subunit delta [Acidobacteria bacterium]|nr:DNA polymerase III subunit delta [Acidobacteriota bacterium]MBI3279388.1 DNA polymerase III subunit delta [Acidobacteriota bacterium]